MGRIRYGVHRELEDEANRLIKESLEGVTKHSDKSDILTPWKEAARYKREIYVAEGVPDKAFRQGMFHRVANINRPDLNSRDGISRGARIPGTRSHSPSSSLRGFVDADKYSFDDE